jgi:hypothetical protein
MAIVYAKHTYNLKNAASINVCAMLHLSTVSPPRNAALWKHSSRNYRVFLKSCKADKHRTTFGPGLGIVCIDDDAMLHHAGFHAS